MLSVQKHGAVEGSVRTTRATTLLLLWIAVDSQSSLISGPQIPPPVGRFLWLMCSPLSYCNLISLRFKSIRTLVANNLTEVFRGGVRQSRKGGGVQGFTIHMPEATPASCPFPCSCRSSLADDWLCALH
jgi:hypothetical protein